MLCQVENLEAKLVDTAKALQDCQLLYLDANKNLSEKCQEIFEQNVRLAEYEQIEESYSTLKKNFDKLEEEHQTLQKQMVCYVYLFF